MWCLHEVGFKSKRKMWNVSCLARSFYVVERLVLESYSMDRHPDFMPGVCTFYATCFQGFSMKLLELATSVVQGKVIAVLQLPDVWTCCISGRMTRYTMNVQRKERRVC